MALAQATRESGRREEALAILLEMLDTEALRLESNRPTRAVVLESLGVTYESLDRLEPALEAFEGALALQEVDDVNVDASRIGTLRNRAHVLYRLGHVEEALRQNLELLALLEPLSGPGSTDVALTNFSIARALQDLDRDADALPYARAAYEGWLASVGPLHVRTLRAVVTVGDLLEDLGDPVGALEHFTLGFEGRLRTLGADDPETVDAAFRHARLACALGDDEQAARSLPIALGAVAVHPGLGAYDRLVWNARGFQVYARLDRDEDAERCILACLREREVDDDPDGDFATHVADVVGFYEGWASRGSEHAAQEARSWREEFERRFGVAFDAWADTHGR
ncbi:MAG: tetratricopeptide repeat protein [Planctomycetota bacterium]